MKRRFLSFTFIIFTGLLFSGCSNLFENIINDDYSFKNGDDSLLQNTSSADSKSSIFSGLAVIKNTQKETNQINYKAGQTVYFVGSVPSGYDDLKVDYTNGTNKSLFGKDDPVELRCFVNDIHSTVDWTLTQTWAYIPDEEIWNSKDYEGNDVTFRGIKAQHSQKLEKPVSVNSKQYQIDRGNYLVADLPYGVTVATCTVTADDQQYSTKYTIVLTKEYIPTIAESPASDKNNITDHGLVVIKASDPGRNAINYSSTTYEYEIGDSSGINQMLDLTGKDDSIIFKCFTLDPNAELSWKAVQTKEYQPVWNSNGSGITKQNLVPLSSPLEFDFVNSNDVYSGSKPFMQFLSDDKHELKTDLPYGVTEVFAIITSYNSDGNGNIVSNVSQYKITLTKRYIITSAANNITNPNDKGLAVYANGKTGNLISYNPEVLNYTVDNLNGSADPVKIEFRPEEPAFTTTEWSAFKTHNYEPETHSVSAGSITYTYQSNGKYVELSEAVNLLADYNGVNAPLKIENENTLSFCAGNLPYGRTVVTITTKSLADSNSSTTYTITLNKKQVSTKINIISTDGSELSTITDRGLVVLSAENDSLNKISFSPEKTLYTVNDIKASDNDMKFRCYLADTDARIEWEAVQVKEFEKVVSTYSKKVIDPELKTEETVSYTYISGQTEKDCYKPLYLTPTQLASANEVTATIPFGITEVKATISSADEAPHSYTIKLIRDICKENISQEDFSKKIEKGEGLGNYSQLKELSLDVGNTKTNGSSKANFTPAFNPAITTYNLVVNENADTLHIGALAADDKATISEPKVFTKYGQVPSLSNMNINLVGGKSRITFTVTDETGIARTYTIYVEKPEDGDTSLESLKFTPAASFENGIKGFTHDNSYKGESDSAKSKYLMTLSADSRKDISEITFTAEPTNKRTVVSYGISDSDNQLPSQWSASYTKASPKSQKVYIGNTDTSVIKKYLWIKTVSDEYFHKTDSGYENEKRADILYHKIELTKAGDKNKELTAFVAVATYENGTSKEVISDLSDKEVSYKVKDNLADIDKITTFAYKLELYFRPLDKDAEITFDITNEEHYSKDDDSVIKTNLKDKATLTKINGNCEYLKDSSNEYYKLTIGSIGTATDSSNDLPRGTTRIKINDRTFTFIKPDLKNVNYSIAPGKGELKWNNYIYLTNNETDLSLTLTSVQQNQILSVESCQHTHNANGNEVSQKKPVTANIKQDDTSTVSSNRTKWIVNVSDIPVGTTTLKIKVTNNLAEKIYTYYIVRAGNTETRLKNISFAGKTLAGFQDSWNAGMKDSEYTYVYETKLNVNDGNKLLKVEPVSSESYITIEKLHSSFGGITSADNENWPDSDDDKESLISGKGILTVTSSFTEENADANAGSIMYIIKVAPSESEEATHIYYVIVHVEADTNAKLNALKIIQKGNEKDRTILANSFKPENLNYDNLFASLNYTGDIIITPTKYPKAKIIQTKLELGNEEVENNEITIASDGRITIPYSVYSTKLGKVYTISYTVQAQDTSVPSVTYKVELKIPDYETVKTITRKQFTETKSFEISSETNGGLGYRFGSVIADEGLAIKDLFGGLDIIGTADGTNWYESSFGGSGLQFAMNIDGINYWAKLNNKGGLDKLYKYDGTAAAEEVEKPEGIDFSVHPEFVKEGEKVYLKLNLNVENSYGKAIKLGAAIDTLIGTLDESTNASNDTVSIESTNNGITMKGKDYNFSLILKNAFEVDDVSELWYGAYDEGKFFNKIFDTNKVSKLNNNEDSAVSFYWDLGNEGSSTKRIRIIMEK